MKKFSVTALMYNLLVCLLVAMVLTPHVGFEVGLGVPAVLFCLGFVRGEAPQGVLREEVIKRLFLADLQERLYPDNSFYVGAQVDEGAEIDQASVEIPQDEDGEARGIINPTQFPLQTYTEEDLKKTYDIDLFATLPQVVTDVNQAVVSYDKRAAKLRKHISKLNDDIANGIMFRWMPNKAAFIRKTTGASTRPATAPGATGTRKVVTQADVLFYFTLFNTLNIPVNGRRAVFPPDMYEDLLSIPNFVDADKLGKMGVVPSGVIGSIYGFNIYLRSKTTIFTEAATPVKKPTGAAAAATDNLAALFFHPQFVRWCKGTPKIYLNADKGEYLGGTLNAALRSGGTQSRLSEIGVAALVQSN